MRKIRMATTTELAKRQDCDRTWSLSNLGYPSVTIGRHRLGGKADDIQRSHDHSVIPPVEARDRASVIGRLPLVSREARPPLSADE